MNNQTINILLIEDAIHDAKIIKRFLGHRSMPSSTIQWVTSLADAEQAIQQTQIDLILTDLGLPDSWGLETVVRLRENNERLPIIALTRQDDEELGLAVIRAGANEFIPKNQLSRPIICRAVAYTMERFRMANEIVDANRLLINKNERLAQMYKMSQQFVDNVSHEFRTPLTVIREFAAIVRDGIDGPVTDSQKKRLGTLINRTDDLANMVDDLLDTSRLEAGLLKICRQEYPLSEIVERVERMLRTRAATKSIQLEIREIPSDLAVFCDEEKLRRVLINLLVNAIKFTPVGGKIEISAAMADKNRVSITVSDNGPGIAKDELDRIFERFQQVEAHHRMASCRGFGLGLSIARALASLNLGNLHVASVEGKGSQFSVLVPIAKLESVLHCYLEQIETTLDMNGDISLVEVCPTEIGSQDRLEILETIDEFLRSSVKTFDLVLQTQEDRWLMYTCNSQFSLPKFKQRITDEWEKQKRNHFGAPLPDLNIENKISVNVLEGRQELINFVHKNRTTKIDEPIHTHHANRILVVDDEIEVAGAIEARLRACGFEVTTTHDGLEGLNAAKQCRPDAILLDIRMPKMDGLTVLHRLKSNPLTASIPVIVLSASLHDKQRALERGACFFIQKPFHSESLMAAIDTAMRDHPTVQPPESAKK